jgi:hypothetical protein
MSTSGIHVVMFDGVSNYPKGARLGIDDLYHADLPGRKDHWQRLLDLGAIKPESDPEAAALPVAYPTSGGAPVIPAGGNANYSNVSVPKADVAPTVDRYMPLPDKATKLAEAEHQPAVQGDGELKPTPERATRAAR